MSRPAGNPPDQVALIVFAAIVVDSFAGALYRYVRKSPPGYGYAGTARLEDELTLSVTADPRPPYIGTFAHTVSGTLPVSRFVAVESSVAPSGLPGPFRVACMIPMFATRGSVPPFAAEPREPYAFTWKAISPVTMGECMNSLFGNSVSVAPICSLLPASWSIRHGPYVASAVKPSGSATQLNTSMSGSESRPCRIAL